MAEGGHGTGGALRAVRNELSGCTTHQAVASHAATVLWLVTGHGNVELPDDVSRVAVGFAEAICEHHAELASQLAGLIRRTAHWDPVDLAEALLRDIDIPTTSEAHETLDWAWVNLRRAMAAPLRHYRLNYSWTAAHFAAESICVWAREQDVDLRHPASPNHPPTLLATAVAYLTERQEVHHA